MKKRMQHALLVGAVVLILVGSGRVQTQNPQTPPDTASPQGKAGDVDTMEHIVSAVYDAISGPAGPRDWDRFRSLYYAGARMIPSRRQNTGKISAFSLTVDQYIDRAKPFFDKEGFYEAPVSNRVELWDHIAHVWSTYESRHAKGEKPFARGINSFQLLYDGSRWWVLTVYWEGEDPGHPLPEKYLSR